MKQDLTDEQKQAYLKKQNLCPFCSSKDFDREDDIDIENEDWVIVSYFCNACKRAWDAKFKLSEIVVTDLEDDE